LATVIKRTIRLPGDSVKCFILQSAKTEFSRASLQADGSFQSKFDHSFTAKVRFDAKVSELMQK
jgi:hypothetical protein